MATNTITYNGDATLSQNHPKVVSLVSNAEDIYQASNGGLRTFAAIVCEKGVEDVQIVSGTTDFINLYGQPNIRKYGQQAYNIIKWLNAGGEAAILRVLPDDAGFSNAFLNIQTKINSKTKKIGKETLNINDVTIRTVISSTSNNSNETVLKYELSKQKNDTVDGFKQNMIMLIQPNGRGEYYNKLGIRLTSNKQFDSISKSRMYNFEVVEYNDDNNVISIKEGPFRVSFDKDALSTTSQESLYIEDVINTYSKYIKVTVNHDAIIEVATIINPKVYPYSIDMIFGEDRYVNGVMETFDYSTDVALPIQVALHSYNAAGNPIMNDTGEVKKNIINGNEELQGYTIDMDNSYNLSLRNNYLKSISSMKQAAIGVKKGNFATMAASKCDALTAIKTSAKPKFANEASLLSVITDCRNTLDFLRSVKTDNTDLDIIERIEAIEKAISQYKGIKSRVTTISSLCADLKNDFNSALATNINSSILSNAGIIMDEASSMISSLKESSLNALNALDKFTATTEKWVGEKGLIEADITTLENLLKTDIEVYQTAIDEFETDEAKLEALNKIKGANANSSIAIVLIEKIRNAASNLEIKANASLYSENLFQVICGSNELIDDIVATKAAKVSAAAETGALDNIRATISNLQNYRGEMVPLVQSVLQSMNNPARLRMGSEGSIEMDNKDRESTIKALLLSAYSGALNDKILNKKVLPFNFIMDAGYDVDIKNIIASLASDVRKDFVFIADCGYDQPTVASTLNFRSQFNLSSNYTAIYGQEVVVYDQYTNRDQKFTIPYLLSTKLPTLYSTVGLHYPIAGNKRGVLEGFKSISYTPNDQEQEELYNNRVNYAVSDTKRTKLMSQLTSNYSKTPLSDLNNVITMLSIKRDAEGIMEGYQFEFADTDTIRAMNSDLTSNLNKYITGNAVDSIDVEVYASDYDLTQHVVRANITIKFKAIIETVIITLEVTN